MKKVLIATDYFYPHWTGISKAFYNLTRSLQDTFDFTIVTVQYDKSLKTYETIDHIPIYRSPYIFSLSRAKYSLSIIGRFWQETQKTNAVLINSPCTNILIFSIITKLLGKKLFIFHQGDLILPKSFVNKIIEIIFDICSYISLSLADHVATYTQDYAQHSRILKPFLNKFTLLLLPVIVEKSQASSPTSKVLKNLKKERKIVLGFAGRFVEEKGFDVLFDAIPEVIKAIPQAHFVFAGETNMGYEDFFGKHQKQFKQIEKHLSLLGLLKDNDLAAFYEEIDFIVIPSRSDCFNLVQAEAMLCESPSLVADIPGCRYMVKTSGFGMIFEKENPRDLANTIVKAIQSRKQIEKNYDKVLKILDNKKNVEKIKNFLKS